MAAGGLPHDPNDDVMILNYSNPTYNKHLDYLEGMQIPKDSATWGIKEAIARVRGLRSSGKISLGEANKRVRKLNKGLFRAAKLEGISTRETKGGKKILSVTP